MKWEFFIRRQQLGLMPKQTESWKPMLTGENVGSPRVWEGWSLFLWYRVEEQWLIKISSKKSSGDLWEGGGADK